MRKLVIYYSLEGNTKLISDTLAKTLEADILRLEPVKDIHPTWFMKYMRGGKQVIMKETPMLKHFTINPNQYDLIIIGTPVRAFNYTPACRTFFQEYKLEQKKIAFFCTHEGNAGKTLINMRNRLPNNEIITTKDFPNVSKHKEETIEETKKRAKKIMEYFKK